MPEIRARLRPHESKVSSLVGTEAHQQRAQEITDATVTRVTDDADTLPLATGTQKILVTGASVTPGLAERIPARGPAAPAYNTGTAPNDATNKAWTSAGQQKLVEQLVATENPAAGDPSATLYPFGHGLTSTSRVRSTP